jgi:hypothetical protein
MEGPWVQKNAQKETMEKYAYSKDVQVVLGSMVKVGAKTHAFQLQAESSKVLST